MEFFRKLEAFLGKDSCVLWLVGEHSASVQPVEIGRQLAKGHAWPIAGSQQSMSMYPISLLSILTQHGLGEAGAFASNHY
jgi:hypothetical protein